MTRLWAWLGLGLIGLGVTIALLIRLLWPTTLLHVGFLADFSIVTLIAGLTLGLCPLLLSVLQRWRSRGVQKALAQQTAAHETEHRRFIQRLDHELKNPLTAIQVQLDNLHASPAAPAQAVDDLRGQVSRLTSLTRGLRRLSDLETRALELEKVEFGELLEEVSELLESPQRLQVEVQRVPWPIPPIDADRELLLMVFRNLVDNALKYSAGPVQVRARDASGALRVEVIDTGRGIPAEEVALVAEELYRATNTRDVSGSGLGLALVKRVIERHNGRLTLQSRLNQGTIATVELPYKVEKAGGSEK